ncbi:MAG TPA: cation-transporting P-type ATPase [Streptosporangiaceae bacterium]|nr:cation-transporting P-type ATPase [Streptosporangiaceae bacterium]
MHIAVHGVSQERGTALARATEAALRRHPAVSWAAVNAPLGTVVAACSDDVPAAELISVVEQVERDHAVRPETAASRPGAIDRVPVTAAALAAGVAGLSFAGVGRALRTVRLPVELGSLVQFADSQPRLRAAVERALGADRADLAIGAASALAQSAAHGISGLAVDSGLRIVQLAEALSQRAAWQRSEPQLCGDTRRAAARPVTPERPRPLPPGPVERYGERIGLAAAGAFGGVLVASHDPRRAAGVALAGLPKPARLGREGFAAALGCFLARRGAVIIDRSALRRLDRIDTIVIDADVLTTGAFTVSQVVSLAGADPVETSGVVVALFAGDRIAEARTDGTFTLGPLAALGPREPAGIRAAARLTRGGAAHVLGLARGQRLVAVVGVSAEQHEAADIVVAEASRAGLAFMIAGTVGAAGIGAAASAGAGHDGRAAAQEASPGALGGYLTLLDGGRLVASVRGLQADGAGVLLVSRQRRALAAADCGIGLASADGRPAWGAHILIGDDLTAAALLIDAVGAARAASRRSVSLSQAGTALGAALALGGRAPDAAAASLLTVNGAAAIALTAGVWSAAEVARRPAAVPARPTRWHEMPVSLVLSQLRSGPGGLSGPDARDRWRPEEGQPPEPSLPRAFLAELANPLTPILAGGAALSASIGAVTDAVIVTGVSALSALMGGIQRVYTERSLARLFEASAVTARVLRDGVEQTLPAARLVVGDIVLVGAGDVVPADCRLLEARALQVDESSLTGESLPVDKTAEAVTAHAVADRRSMLYEGTTLAAGQARAVVVATGSATEAGRSLAALSGAAPVSGVEARLAQITRTTLPLALGSAGAVLAAASLRGRPASQTIGAAVGLAVASVPEGLPFLVSAAQLAAARRLAVKGALVRNPRTIEALGRVNVLCFDKTGTLTQGRMAVSAVSDGSVITRTGALRSSHRRVLAAALRATPRARRGRRAGHMTDAAVAAAAAAERVGRPDEHPGWRHVDTLPFEPSRGFHATLGESRGGALLSVKGAPELILPRCTHWHGRSIGPRERKQLNSQLERLTRDGYRVLAIAEDDVPAGYQLSDDAACLSFSGFVAFGDPVRRTALASVRDLRDAGVHVVMITGDHPATATAIAAELDVLNGGTIVTGPDLDRLDEDTLGRALQGASVIARCTPAHKVRVVQAFQRLGRTVAMTGDGANDAAAIRLADVGIALGRRGTPAARAAADLVVSDDRLETILAAVVEGRAMWASARQAIGILVGGNIGEIGYALLGALLTGRSPLSARQLLLVNLLTDLAPATAIALRTPEAETAGSLLAEGPDTSLGSALTEEVAVRAMATGASATAAWLAGRITGRPARARTVGLAALIGTQLGQTMLIGWRSPLVAIASLVSIGALVAVVQTPLISQFFGCTPIGPGGWLIASGCSLGATAGSLLLPRLGRSLSPAVQSLGDSANFRWISSLLADRRTRAARDRATEQEPAAAQGMSPQRAASGATATAS